MVGEMMITSDVLAMMQQQGVAQSLLDESRAIELIGHFLKSEMEVEEEVSVRNQSGGTDIMLMKRWKTPPGVKPLVNEDGFYFIMNTVGVCLQKGSATGNIEKWNANLIVQYVLNNISVGLYKTVPTGKYGVTTINDADVIVDDIALILVTHVSKSVDMSMVKNLVQHVQVSEIRDNSKIMQQQASLPRLAM